jgi:choline dehydrogenase-like flavoprotein
VRDLYVADASLFPTASGVNPMLTVAALAHHVAARLAHAL